MYDTVSLSLSCYQNILSLAMRESRDLNLEVCKIIIGNLLETNKIINISKDKKTESFKIVEQKDIEEENGVEIKDGEGKIESKTGKEERKDAEFKDGEDDIVRINALENYVDDKFHDVLLNIIKREVDAAVKFIVKNDGHKSDNSSLNSTMEIN